MVMFVSFLPDKSQFRCSLFKVVFVWVRNHPVLVTESNYCLG
jgi:hypothetical protein